MFSVIDFGEYMHKKKFLPGLPGLPGRFQNFQNDIYIFSGMKFEKGPGKPGSPGKSYTFSKKKTMGFLKCVTQKNILKKCKNVRMQKN
jgi:hypothetical protein